MDQAVTAPSPPPTFGAQQQWATETYTRLLLEIFEGTTEIDGDARSSIRGSVESSVHAVAPFLGRRQALLALEVRWQKSFAEHFPHLLVLIGLIAAVFGAAGQTTWTRILFGLLSAAAAFGGYVAALGLTTATMWLLRRLTNVRSPRVPAFALTALVFIGSAMFVGGSSGPWWLVAAARNGLWATGLLFALFLVIAQTLHVARVVARHQTIRKVPAAETIAAILLTLDEARRAPDRGVVQAAPPAPGFVVVAPNGESMRDVDAFPALVQQLEDTIERALPALVATADDAARWAAVEARAISAAIERLRRDLLLGTSAGVDRLRASLAIMLGHVARGHWGALERGDPQLRPASRSSPIDVVRTVVIAGFPLALGLALRLLDGVSDVDQAAVDGLVRFGIGWAISIALVAFDAKAVDRIGGANTVLSALPT